jgi:outer membrane lipoprotein SlyB
MKINRTIAIMASAIALSACATQPTAPYTAYLPTVQSGVVQNVVLAQVISVQPLMLSGGSTWIGTGAGAAVGAIAGTSIGHGKGSIIGGILGGVAGSAIGSGIQNAAQTEPGIEIIMQNQYRQTVSVSQPFDGQTYAPGDIVKIISGNPTRVTH